MAILASILFPVFAKAREKARQSSCLSNVKQLTIGCISYAQDYDEELPRGAHSADSSWGAGDTSWRSMILPYVKNVQIFQCPSNKFATGAFDGALADGGQNAGYGINHCHSAAVTSVAVSPSLGQAEDASSVVLLLESDGPLYVQNTSTGTHGTAFTGAAAKRHNDGMNTAFIDGHAKWFKPQNLCPATGDCLLTLQQE